MNLEADRIARQLRLGEDSDWEFEEFVFRGDRPIGPRRNDLADEIAAFANGSGGVLLCGVRDSGEVVGMSRPRLDEVGRLLVEVSTDAIAPPVRIRARRWKIEGKEVLLVEVPTGDARHDSPGGSFVRVGASKRNMKADERLRLARRRSQARCRRYDEQAVPQTGFGTLDADLWKPLLTEEGAVAPKTRVEKSGLLTPDEKGTLRASVAGILVACREPERYLPNACITATRYRGTDRASGQTDARTITGPLDRQITEAVSFVIRNMTVAAEKVPARAELPEYRAEAIFEAVVNAVAHRDYGMRRSRVRISMFSDRLEIQSPGGPPNDLEVADLPHRQATRNELLTSLLGRMSAAGIHGAAGRLYFIERRGDGVPIIRRSTQELTGLLPEFRLVGESELCVVIPAAPLRESAGEAVIRARREGMPLPGLDLFLTLPDGTTRRAATDAAGEARLSLRLPDLPVNVFAAGDGSAARVERGWRPLGGPLDLEIGKIPNGGSVVFGDDGGVIPGLSGRLTPSRDSRGRLRAYASTLSIEEGRSQPVTFLPGEELRLTDAEGRERMVRILTVNGSASLVEYRDLKVVKGSRVERMRRSAAGNDHED